MTEAEDPVGEAPIDPDLMYPEGDSQRVVSGPWQGAASLARTLFPLIRGGAVIMSTDANNDRLVALAARENAVVAQ